MKIDHFSTFFKKGYKKGPKFCEKSPKWLHKIFKFHFFEKQKIYIGDNIVINHHAKKLRNRSIFECVAALDARARAPLVVSSK